MAGEGPIFEVTKRLRFSAAHFLPNHDGACQRVHGHNFELYVTCRGEPKPPGSGPDEGMVVEFADLKQYWTEVLEPNLDHALINDSIGPELQGHSYAHGMRDTGADIPPTTEWLAWFIGVMFRNHGFPVVRVDLDETENNRATVRWEDVGDVPARVARRRPARPSRGRAR